MDTKNRCDTNARNPLLGIFAILSVFFASLTLSEYNQVNTLNSQLQGRSENTYTETLTSTATVGTTYACPSMMTCAAFGYSPNAQVKIVSVEANTTAATTLLVFWVTV